MRSRPRREGRVGRYVDRKQWKRHLLELLPSQLKSSQTPKQLIITPSGDPEGVCFDKSSDLWVTDDSEEILEFTPSQLKTLGTGPNPTAAVKITSSSFKLITGCTFDKHGNLWLADDFNNSVDEISAAQLKAGSASITPAVIITVTTGMSGANPGFVTFDKAGNLWIDGRGDEKLLEFSAAQLTSGGDKTAAVILGGGGSLFNPGQLAFDGPGNLWVSSFVDNTVVMFPKSQIGQSNNNAPAVTISSSSLVGPYGLGFRGANLWVLDFGDGNASEFLPSQIKSSGSPAPKVLLTGAAPPSLWETTFGPAFGKLP